MADHQRRHSMEQLPWSPRSSQTDMIYILSLTIININRDISLSNSFDVYGEEHSLLNEREIVTFWKAKRYDAHWFMCIAKEQFVAVLTNKWKDISVLTVIKLYNELRKRIIGSNNRRYYTLFDDNIAHIESETSNKHKNKSKYVFLWDESMTRIIHCNDIHFIFICAQIIDEMNRNKIENDEYPLFDRRRILYYLQRIHMNGSLFKSIHKMTFINSLKYCMTQLSSAKHDINMLILANISDETPSNYAEILYDEIDSFHIKFASDKICILDLHDTHPKWSTITQQHQDNDNRLWQHEKTDDCKEWDITDDKEWSRMDNFDAMDSVGYTCDDSIVVIGDIIDREMNNETNKTRKIKLKFKTDYLSNPFVSDGLWINTPNDKLCNPLHTTQSHRHIFSKWMVTLAHKLQYKVMAFDRDLYENIYSICDNHPMLIFTLKYDNYECALWNKTYTEILKSFFSWCITLKCERTNCDKKPKMLCRCDCNKFPLYSYQLALALIAARDADDVEILHYLRNENNHKSIKDIVKKMSLLLPEQYRDKMFENNYIKRYKDYIGYWLKFDFYNFVCCYCLAINGTIMVNRIYSYNSTLRNCRVCGTRKIAMKMHMSESKEHQQVTKSIDWICETLKDPDIREFEAERAIIDYQKLRQALVECRYSDDIYYDGSFDEDTLFRILKSVLREKWFFDAFYYYIRHFYGYDKWVELRLNISFNYYFFASDESYVDTKELMKDAGFSALFDEHIFQDCYERAFCSNTNYDEDMMSLLFYGDNTLCIDDASLRGMERISPSVKTFVQDIVQVLSIEESYVFGEESNCNESRDEDDKIIDHGWVYDNNKQRLNAIRIWCVDGDGGSINGIQLQMNGEWDINKIYGSTQGKIHKLTLDIDVNQAKKEEKVTEIRINFKDKLSFIKFSTNQSNAIQGGDKKADGSGQYISIGEKLIGLRITTSKNVIAGIQFKWRHTNAFEDVRKKLMRLIKNLEKFKINSHVFPILSLIDFRNIVSSIHIRDHAKDRLECIVADAIWAKLNIKYGRNKAYTNDMTNGLVGDLATFDNTCSSPRARNIGILGDFIDGSGRKKKVLQIKSIIAFYEIQSKIPTFDEFVRDTNIKFVDEFKEEIKSKYDDLYLAHTETERSSDIDDTKDDEKQEGKLYNFLTGMFIRYTVLDPKFTCLAEECMLNEVIRINMNRWNLLLSQAKDIYKNKKINMFSNSESDKNFGIEKYSPIGIQHIMAIKIYTESTDYAHQLSRSYWRLKLNQSNEKLIQYIHCNNFYWIGRLLYEAVEFFGERFDENKEYTLFQGMRHIYKFENFSCCLNYPSSTTNNPSVAHKFAGKRGCIIKFRPKYIGAINNTKFMNVSQLSGFDEGERLFFGNSCELQIEQMTLYPNVFRNTLELKDYLPALIYLEKILQQTMFNIQFYNSNDLYTNYRTTQKLLLKLIHIYLDLKEQKKNINDIMTKHFSNKLKTKQRRAIRYVVKLLSFWCKGREYVSFETLHLEYEYMIDKLRNFFTEKIHQRFYIKSKNIMNLLPNLKYYRNYDKQLIYVKHSNNGHYMDEKMEEDDYFEDSLLKALTPRKRSRSQKQVKFSKIVNIAMSKPHSVEMFPMTGMERNTTEDTAYTDFDDSASMFAEYEDNDDDDKDESKKETRLITYAQKHAIPHIMLDLLEEIGFQFEQCISVRKRALRARVLNWSVTANDVMDKHNGILVPILRNLGVKGNIAEKVRGNLCKKGVINNKTRKAKIASFVVDELEDYGFQFNLEQCNIEMDKYKAKRLFLELYKKTLSGFYELIQNLDKTATKSFVDLAQTIKEISLETATELHEHVFRKILEEKSRIKPWKCSHCWFRNRKLLVGKQWRFYNVSFECGLCGASRLNLNNKTANNLNHRITSVNLDKIAEEDSGDAYDYFERSESIRIEIPKEIKKYWKNIPQQPCLASAHTLQNSFTLSMVLSAEDEESTDDDDDDDGDGGHDFSLLNTKGMGTLSSSSLLMPLTQLKSHEMANCTAIHRLCVILSHFHHLTEELTSDNPCYRYDLKAFLCKLSGYSAIKLIDDVDHLLRDHDVRWDTINHNEIQDRYGILCESCRNCVYSRRSQRDTQTSLLNIEEKKELFHTNNVRDFVYISVLDRAHVLLLHIDDGDGGGDDDNDNDNYFNRSYSIQKRALQKDSNYIVKYSKYPVYSTGVYMQYDALTPLHLHLKEELTANKLYSIGSEDWTVCLEKGKILTQSTNAKGIWKSNETNEAHGIEKNDSLQIEHILCIIFYCDFSDLCQHFRNSYRDDARSDGEIQKYHSCNYYWFGRFVYSAIQFCGEKPLKPNKAKAKHKPFYHGLKCKFLFSFFSANYETPTSTTYDLSVAQQFAGRCGIILSLGPKYKSEVNYSRCLDVSTISDFHGEKERLFGGMTELAIINIIDVESDAEERCEMNKCFKVLLYFERLMQQTVYNCDYYNYGHLKQREIVFQSTYLVPLIQKQMGSIDIMDMCHIPPYIVALFEHFCDSKHEYINLSCIKKEVQNMHQDLKQILFRIRDNENTDRIQINNESIKKIFPKLKKYKNPLDHWITLRE